jgi:hypothetical protein
MSGAVAMTSLEAIPSAQHATDASSHPPGRAESHARSAA